MELTNEQNKVYGERIKKYRERAHLSQAQVASALGMNRSTYARREKEGSFACEMIFTMAALFHIPSEWIFYGEEKYNPLLEMVKNHEPEPPARLESPVPSLFLEDDLILTNDEKNKIKIIRRLSPEDKKFLNEFLQKHK